MVPALGCELAATLVVLDYEPGPEKKLLRNLAHRAGRQAEPGGDYVQAAVPLGQDAKVVLLGRPEAKRVDLFKQASPLKVRQGNRPLSF